MFKKMLRWVERKLFGPGGISGLWPENDSER